MNRFATPALTLLVWAGIQNQLLAGYDPNQGRWLSRDPRGEDGGLNLYAYVQNNPVGAIDPLGLETAVVIGGPYGKNIFGHVAIATTGSGVYSSGTIDPFGSSFTDYIKSQSTYRNSTIYLIPTTPEQETQIIAAFRARAAEGRNAETNNCSNIASNALRDAGVLDRETPFPASLQDALEQGVLQQDVTVVPIPRGAPYLPSFLGTFNKQP